MMSAETIREMADAMAQSAREQGLEPSFEPPIPGLGEYIPAGWQLQAIVFCDSSGFGNDSEAALSVAEFEHYRAMHPEYAYGVIDAGQFQVHVGAFLQVPSGAPKVADEVVDLDVGDWRRARIGGGT